MAYDAELKAEVDELVSKWFAQARATDLEMKRHNKYHCNDHLSSVIGAMQFYVAALAAALGREHHTVEFLLENIPRETELMGMAAVQTKMKGIDDDKDSA